MKKHVLIVALMAFALAVLVVWMQRRESAAVTVGNVQGFVRTFNDIPPPLRKGSVHRVLNLIPDANAALLAGVLLDKSQPQEIVLEVLNDIVNRSEAVKEPVPLAGPSVGTLVLRCLPCCGYQGDPLQERRAVRNARSQRLRHRFRHDGPSGRHGMTLEPVARSVVKIVNQLEENRSNGSSEPKSND